MMGHVIFDLFFVCVTFPLKGHYNIYIYIVKTKVFFRFAVLSPGDLEQLLNQHFSSQLGPDHGELPPE